MSGFRNKDDASLIRFSDDAKGEIFNHFGLIEEHCENSTVFDLTAFCWIHNSDEGLVVWAQDEKSLFSDELEGKKGRFPYKIWFESKHKKQILYEADADFGIHVYFLLDLSKQIIL